MSSEAVNQKTDNIVAKSKEQRIKTYTESEFQQQEPQRKLHFEYQK
jgi:hypothetical protein